MKYRYLKNVVTLQMEQDKCSGCGMCIQVCHSRSSPSMKKSARSLTGMPAWSAAPVPRTAPSSSN